MGFIRASQVLELIYLSLALIKSQDDEVTIKQKIDYANSIGLGGLLIWSVCNRISKRITTPLLNFRLGRSRYKRSKGSVCYIGTERCEILFVII